MSDRRITLRGPLGQSRQYTVYTQTTVTTLIHAALLDGLANPGDRLDIVHDGQTLLDLDQIADGAVLDLIATGSAV